MQQHFLIVGQGLAGSLIGLRLIEREQIVTVVDYVNPGSASRIAAGIMNPVSGQRMVLAPEVMHCLPLAIERYQQLAILLNTTFYHSLPLLRLFHNPRDRDRYRSRCNDPAYSDYIGDEFAQGQSGEPIDDRFAGYLQQQTGYLDINVLLQSAREFFSSQATIVDDNLDYADLSVTPDIIQWKGRSFDQVIFAEGVAAVDNPWFRWLPFQLSKGELITIQTQQDLPKSIINKGHWLLPQGKELAKVGATYQWEWRDELPSMEAQQELLNAGKQMLDQTNEVMLKDHQAGIRPTTKDKQPFIGTHPVFERLHCCNGLGSRGATIAPFCVEKLVNYLLKHESLPQEIDIRRFQQSTSLVVQARRYISENIAPGDVVIDATTGNGHDTELMARCVGENGHVIGFDIQDEAIANTRQRLERAGLIERVKLLNKDHARLSSHLPNNVLGIVSLVTFNLGFLPGSDKLRTTAVETTIAALNDAVSVVKTQGKIVVMTYAGHECGKNETKSVKQWLHQLDKAVFDVKITETQQKIDAPSLYVITKTNKLT